VVKINRPKWGVVVDYRDDVLTNRYLVVETDALGRGPHGPGIWLDSSEFEATDRISRRPGRLHRANLKEGSPEQRGCGCLCCVHMAGYEEEI
jgi:hypothetical protein